MNQLYRELGSRLKVARTQRGLTQTQIAERLALERTSITNVESGRQRLPLHTLYQYCDILGIAVKDALPDRLPLGPEVELVLGDGAVMIPSSVHQVIQRFAEEK